jgi:hypothetical protein
VKTARNELNVDIKRVVGTKIKIFRENREALWKSQ